MASVGNTDWAWRHPCLAIQPDATERVRYGIHGDDDACKQYRHYRPENNLEQSHFGNNERFMIKERCMIAFFFASPISKRGSYGYDLLSGWGVDACLDAIAF